MTPARQLPSFWLTVLIGWVPIVPGTIVAAATALGEPNKLAQHAMLLVACLLPSISFCLMPLSFLLAFAGTTVITGLATRQGGHVGALRGAFHRSFVFGSMDIVWFVLLALCRPSFCTSATASPQPTTTARKPNRSSIARVGCQVFRRSPETSLSLANCSN